MENEYLELQLLKRRAKRGTRVRHVFNTTLSTNFIESMGMVIPVGNGKYASSFMEFSGWLLLALLMSGEDVESVSVDLKNISKSPYLINNLKRLLRILEA